MRNYITRSNGYETFEDVFNNFFGSGFTRSEIMKTDVKENEKNYLLDIEMAGFGKDDIKLSLKEGYLTVTASKHDEEKPNEKNKDGYNYIKRERTQSCQRSYYVGEVDQSTIKAKYENGVLAITIPKDQPEISNQYISIE